MLLLEWDAAGGVLGLAHHLDLLALGADVVENQLRARGTLGIDTAGDSNRDFGLLLALLETLVLLEELAQIVGDLELVGIGIGILGFPPFRDLLASNLKVLLTTIGEFISLRIASRLRRMGLWMAQSLNDTAATGAGIGTPSDAFEPGHLRWG